MLYMGLMLFDPLESEVVYLRCDTHGMLAEVRGALTSRQALTAAPPRRPAAEDEWIILGGAASADEDGDYVTV